MSYKTYENYKESDEEWIGKVPNDWKVPIIKEFFDYRSEKVSDKLFPPLSVTKKGIVPQLENAAKTDNNDSRKKVKKGDFVINSRSDRKGSCGVSDYEGSVSLIYHVLKPKDKNIANFTHYLFRSVMFAEEFYKWGHGIVDDLWSTKYEDMKKIKIPMPPIEDCIKISEFLDKKLNQIEYEIQQFEKLISLLEEKKVALINQCVTKGLNPNVPMKDSGIEWIGEIPEHWDVMKMKFLGDANNGLTYSPNDISDKGLLVLRSSNIQKGKLSFENNVFVNLSINNSFLVQENDLLICSRNGSRNLIGKCAIIPKELEGNTFGAFMMIFRSKYNKFIHYALKSSIFDYYLGTFLTSTINQLTLNNFNNMEIPIPLDLEEQELINNYLSDETSKIDNLIKKIENKIDLLDEYKQSLIYHVVTGKVDVSEVEV